MSCPKGFHHFSEAPHHLANIKNLLSQSLAKVGVKAGALFHVWGVLATEEEEPKEQHKAPRNS